MDGGNDGKNEKLFVCWVVTGLIKGSVFVDDSSVESVSLVFVGKTSSSTQNIDILYFRVVVVVSGVGLHGGRVF